MATQDPTGRGYAVVLKIPADQVRFLRTTFRIAREGVKDELETYPERLSAPDRLRREQDAYGRLLMALDELVIVPDNDVRRVVEDLSRIIDAGNEYERVVSEHEALNYLRERLGGEEQR